MITIEVVVLVGAIISTIVYDRGVRSRLKQEKEEKEERIENNVKLRKDVIAPAICIRNKGKSIEKVIRNLEKIESDGDSIGFFISE